jgi:hypothetical protein
MTPRMYSRMMSARSTWLTWLKSSSATTVVTTAWASAPT